jgi:hypothetical protein
MSTRRTLAVALAGGGVAAAAALAPGTAQRCEAGPPALSEDDRRRLDSVDWAAPAEGWTHPPFAGVRERGSVWGRGAIEHSGGTSP